MGSDHNNSHPISAGCNTGLSLGLGGLNRKHHLRLNNNSSTDNQKQQQQQPTLRFDHVVPSLSLGPVTVNYDDPNTVMLSSPFISTGGGGGGSSISPSNPHLLILSSSNISPGRSSSSYSNNNSSFKRCSEDEVEGSVLDYTNTNKVVASSSRVISDEDEEASPRKKLRLTKDQSAVLEDSFKEHSTLNPSQKQALAKQLNLRPRQVEVWFQNRRARTKLKQTEMDRELLKKCYDTLTEENNKLQREIQQLKALHNNTPTTVNTNNQGATLSLCSSCERRARIAAAGSNSYNHSHQHVSASYNNGTTMSGVTATNNPPRELSFKIASSSAAC